MPPFALISLPVAGVAVTVAQATSDTPFDWVDIVSRAGVIGLFVLFTWAVLTKRLVPGWTYSAMETDRDYYRKLAENGTAMAERQLDLAERLMDRADRDHTRGG